MKNTSVTVRLDILSVFTKSTEFPVTDSGFTLLKSHMSS